MLESDKWSPGASLGKAYDIASKLSQDISDLRWNFTDGTPRESLEKVSAIVEEAVKMLVALSKADTILVALEASWEYPEEEKVNICFSCFKDLDPGEQCDFCKECEKKFSKDKFDPFKEPEKIVRCKACHDLIKVHSCDEEPFFEEHKDSDIPLL